MSYTDSNLIMEQTNMAEAKTHILLDKELLAVEDFSDSEQLQEQFLDLAFGLLRQQSADVMLSKETVSTMTVDQKYNYLLTMIDNRQIIKEIIEKFKSLQDQNLKVAKEGLSLLN